VSVDRGTLLEEVMWRTGLRDPRAAEVALDATLETLGEQLAVEDAAAVAQALPPVFAAALRRRCGHGGSTASALFARVARREGIALAPAVEHAKVACRALTRALAADERTLLRRRLSPEWAELLADPPSGARPAPTRGQR
jgi:uncharacterized protein (DUF2267 family)